MRHDLYAWAGPRDLTPEAAAARIEQWEARGGEPSDAPFEPSSDVAGFYRELEHDLRGMPGFEIVADAEPHTGRGPVWLQTDPPPPAHVTAITLPRTAPDDAREALADLYATATKFDLVVLDAHNGVLHQPMAEMAALASATFWPNGAIRAAIAGVGGLVAAIGAYIIGIPIVSGVVIVIGLFMAVLTVMTFVAEGRKRGAPPS
jgi:hypothetical protein